MERGGRKGEKKGEGAKEGWGEREGESLLSHTILYQTLEPRSRRSEASGEHASPLLCVLCVFSDWPSL